MSDFAAVCWLLTLGFWGGYGYRVWGERRAARAAAALEPHPTHAQFGTWFVEIARKLKTSRRFVGEGIAITNSSTWTVGGIGEFEVIVQEADAPVS